MGEYFFYFCYSPGMRIISKIMKQFLLKRKAAVIWIVFMVLSSRAALFALHQSPMNTAGDNGAKGDFSIEIAAMTGMSYGELGEYVFTSTKKLSELNWELKPVFTAGLSLAAVFQNSFFLGFAWQSGYTRESGNMEDSDWQASDPSIKTNYSRSESVTDSLHETDLNFGAMFPFGDIFFLSLHAGYQFKYFQMVARNGYLQYDPLPYDAPYTTGSKVPMYGLVMRYRQAWHIPYVSLDTKVNLFDGGSLYVSLAYSPAAFCRALDNHLLLDDDYYDSMNWGQYVSVQTGIIWRLNAYLSLSLGVQYEYIPTFKGQSTRVDTDTGNATFLGDDVAGASLSIVQIHAAVIVPLSFLDW